MLNDYAQTLAQQWQDENGLWIVRPTEDKSQLEEIWRNWQDMPPQDKRLSDEKSIELFGMDNTSHYEILQLMYV